MSKWFHFLFTAYLVEQVVVCSLTSLQKNIYKSLVNTKLVRLQNEEEIKLSASSLGFINQIKKLCNRKSIKFSFSYAWKYFKQNDDLGIFFFYAEYLFFLFFKVRYFTKIQTKSFKHKCYHSKQICFRSKPTFDYLVLNLHTKFLHSYYHSYLWCIVFMKQFVHAFRMCPLSALHEELILFGSPALPKDPKKKFTFFRT